MSTHLLRVEHIDVYYEDIYILKDVSIEVQEKEIVSVLGPNGAGKTTLINTISGLNTCRKGEILFMGIPIHNLYPPRVAEIGIFQIPEGRKLFGSMTVFENLEMGAFLINSRKKVMETMAEVFSLFPILKERARQKAGTLSGGEQQMLAIARSLMSGPKFLMLDEPSLGIAPKLVLEIFDKMLEINRREITMLLVEQNLKKALKISNRGYIIQNGRIILEGTGSELLNDEQTMRKFLGTVSDNRVQG
jgi:branched-chain amino acid transport system ATP-binding protein